MNGNEFIGGVAFVSAFALVESKCAATGQPFLPLLSAVLWFVIMAVNRALA